MSILFYKEFHQQLSGVDCRNQIGLYFGPCYGSGKRKEKKKSLPNLCPGKGPIGPVLLTVTSIHNRVKLRVLLPNC